MKFVKSFATWQHLAASGVLVIVPDTFVRRNDNNNNNNNQYIYKQRQSHAMSQRRWLATAVIFRPSDMSLGFAET